MKNIKYMAAWAAVLFAFSACQDVVEVEDLKAKRRYSFQRSS